MQLTLMFDQIIKIDYIDVTFSTKMLNEKQSVSSFFIAVRNLSRKLRKNKEIGREMNQKIGKSTTKAVNLAELAESPFSYFCCNLYCIFIARLKRFLWH